MTRRFYLYLTVLIAATVWPAEFVLGQEESSEPTFPVAAELLVSGEFGGSEGIGFNGEGRLFVTASRPHTRADADTAVRALWEVSLSGEVRHVADLFTTLGIAGIGERDLLVADFGPTSAFKADRNTDGIVWRITPEGEKEAWATGIGDPNFVLVRKDGSVLVSDDARSVSLDVAQCSEALPKGFVHIDPLPLRCPLDILKVHLLQLAK